MPPEVVQAAAESAPGKGASALVVLTVVLCMVSALAMAGGSTLSRETVLDWLGGFASIGSAASSYTVDTHARMVGFLRLAVVLLALTAASAWLSRRFLARLLYVIGCDLVHIRSSTLTALRDTARAHPGELAVFGLLFVGGAALRVLNADQPVEGDEAIVWLQMASRPALIIVTDYSNVGNHILHTLLMHHSWLVFGEGGGAMRLPALIAGVLLIPATWIIVRRTYGPSVALGAAALVAGNSYLIKYSIISRGYALQTLLVLGLLGVTAQLLRRPGPILWGAWPVLVALAMWTLPTSAIACGGIALWYIATVIRRDGRATLRPLLAFVGAGVAAAVLTLLLYAPAMFAIGLDPLLKMMRSGSTDVASGPIAALADLWGVWTRNLPFPFGWMALGLLVWGIAIEHRHIRERVPLGIVMVVWLVVFYLALRTIGYARLWIPFVPLACLLVAVGAVDLAGRLGDLFAPRGSKLKRASAIVLPMAAFLLLCGEEVRVGYARQPTSDSFEPAPRFAAMLPALAVPGEPIVAMQPMGSVLQFELRRQHLPFHFVALPLGPTGSRRVALAIGPAGSPPARSALLVLRNDGHSLAHVLRYYDLPADAAPHHLLTLPGYEVLRLALPPS